MADGDVVSDSSPETATQDGVASEAPAQSSSAPDGEKASMLSVVRDVVQRGEEASASSAEPAAEIQAPDAGPEAPKPEDYSDVPFRKHPRFREVIDERNALRGEAQQYRQIREFMETHSLHDDEAAELLVIGGLMKTNPVQAWERAKPHMQRLAEAAGAILSPALKTQVQKGELTQAQAVAISQANARAQSSEGYAKHYEARVQKQQQVSAQNELRSAIASWESDKSARDPDYAAKKKELVYRLIPAEMASLKAPPTPTEARQILDRVYADVNKITASQIQPKAAVKQPVGGRVSGQPRTAPKSMLDVVRMNRGA